MRDIVQYHKRYLSISREVGRRDGSGFDVRHTIGVTNEETAKCVMLGRHYKYDGLFEIGGQLKIDFQKLILGKVLIFMKFFENVFCYFGYSLNLVF